MRTLRFARVVAVCGVASLLVASSGCQLLVSFDRSLIDAGSEGAEDAAPDVVASEDGSTDGQGPGVDASDGSTGADASDGAPNEEDASDGAPNEEDASDAGHEGTDASDGGGEGDASDGGGEGDASDGGEVDASDAGDAGTDASDAAVPCSAQNCVALDACHTAACSSDVCVQTPITCTASDACHTASCDLAKGCQETPLACTPVDDCHTASCNASTGCQQSPITCSPVDDCHTASCNASTGCEQTSITCKASDACHTASCDSASGCEQASLPCNPVDACHTAACDAVSGCQQTSITCKASDACHTASCDPASGCQQASIPCNPEDACHTASCDPVNGCQQTSIPCDPVDACHTAACDAVKGCQQTSIACTPVDACHTAACDAVKGCQQTAITCSTGFSCDPTQGCVATPLVSGAITEFLAIPGAGQVQFIEIENTGAASDLANATISDGTSTATLHPVSDPTGANKASLILSANQIVWGVANPASAASIPSGASFVWGDPGTTYALSTTAPKIILANAAGTTLATVDVSTSFVTSPSQAVGAHSFPGVTGKSTQWDATMGAATDGANWCVTFHATDTRGLANQACTTGVVNELLEHYPGGDESNTFVEIASPGGALLGGMSVQYADATGAAQSTLAIPAGTRAPVNGIYVVADGATDNGTTNVPNANLVFGSGIPQPAGTTGASVSLLSAASTSLDVLGYGPNPALFAQSPVASLTPLSVPISYARDDASDDAGDNATDFHLDPTPTPGTSNGTVAPAIVTEGTTDGLASTTTDAAINAVVDVADVDAVNGTPVTGDMTATFAGSAAATCTFEGLSKAWSYTVALHCVAPSNGGTVVRGALVVGSASELSLAAASLANGWTYTGVANGTASSVGYCQTDPPTSITGTESTPLPALFGEVYQANDTESGQAANITAQVGLGASGSDPRAVSWFFVGGTYSGQTGTSDHNNQFTYTTGQYPAVSTTTTYAFAWRFSLDQGLNYTYCDTTTNGPGSFDPTQLGQMTVNP